MQTTKTAKKTYSNPIKSFYNRLITPENRAYLPFKDFKTYYDMQNVIDRNNDEANFKSYLESIIKGRKSHEEKEKEAIKEFNLSDVSSIYSGKTGESGEESSEDGLKDIIKEFENVRQKTPESLFLESDEDEDEETGTEKDYYQATKAKILMQDDNKRLLQNVQDVLNKKLECDKKLKKAIKLNYKILIDKLMDNPRESSESYYYFFNLKHILSNLRRQIREVLEISEEDEAGPPEDNGEEKEETPKESINFTKDINDFIKNSEKFKMESFIESFIKVNAFNNNLVSDISSTNYNKYCRRDHRGREIFKPLEPITEIFSDNILLFKLLPQRYITRKGSAYMVAEDITGAINNRIRAEFKKAGLELGGPAVKSLGASVYLDKGRKNTTQTAESIGDIIEETPEIMEDYKRIWNTEEDHNNIYIVSYKIELMDSGFKELIPKLEKILKQLEKENIHLKDVDITRDYKNNLNYGKLQKTLINNGFVPKGEHGTTKILIESESTGNDCITFLLFQNGYKIRAKYYNKFVAQITSPGVRATMGNHLTNYLKPKGDNLEQTFKEGEEVGCTRLEYTIYSGKLRSSDFYERKLEKLFNYAGSEKIWNETSTANQWRALLENIDNSLLVIHKNTFYYAYYVNLLTGKTIGIKKEYATKGGIEATRDKENETKENLQLERNYIINNFSYCNKPLNVVELDINKEESKINIKYNTYLRITGDTLISKKGFKDVFKGDRKINDFKAFNRIDQPFNFKVLEKTPKKEDLEAMDYTDITDDKNILFCRYGDYNREYNKYMESLDIEKKRKEWEQEKEETRNKLKAIIKKLKTKNRTTDKIKSIIAYFLTTTPRGIKNNYKIGDTITINYIKPYTKEGKEKYIIRDQINKKNTYADKYLETVINNNKNKLIKYRDVDKGYNRQDKETVFYGSKELNEAIFMVKLLPSNNPKYAFNYKILVADFNGMETIEAQENENKRFEGVEKLKDLTLKYSEGKPDFIESFQKLQTVDKLKENTKYLITEIYKVDYRKTTRYICKFKDNKDYYTSNLTLTELINELKPQDGTKGILVKSDKMRTNKQKKKELFFML